MTDDQTLLDALASAENEMDEVGDLVAFYRRLLSLIAEQKQHLTLDVAPHLRDIDPATQRETGLPALQFEWLGLELDTFAPWTERVAQVLHDQLPDLDIPADSELLLLAERFYADGTTERGAEIDALLHNALAPWLETAAAQLLPALDLERWQRGYCPVCGGYPDFATLLSDRERRLLCERCRAEWPFPAGVCPFCGEMDADNLGYYGTEDDVYRVDVCDSCGFYVKGVDARHYDAELIPEYERLLTPGLDLVATQEGYARPVGWREE